MCASLTGIQSEWIVCACLLPPIPIHHRPPPRGCEPTTVVHMEQHYGDTQRHRWTRRMQAASPWSADGSLNNAALKKPGKLPPTGGPGGKAEDCGRYRRESGGLLLIILDLTHGFDFQLVLILIMRNHLNKPDSAIVCQRSCDVWIRSRPTLFNNLSKKKKR